VEIPPRAQLRALVQTGLTILLTPFCLASVFFELGPPSSQKFAAAWLGAVIGYWLK
jgi:hypothetical protein